MRFKKKPYCSSRTNILCKVVRQKKKPLGGDASGFPAGWISSQRHGGLHVVRIAVAYEYNCMLMGMVRYQIYVGKMVC